MPTLPARALSAALLLSLAGCLYLPRGVEGVPSEEPWLALPLRSWLAEGRAEPVALAACLDPACPQRLAVSVLRLAGPEAALARTVISDPERLARALRASDAADADPKRRALRTRVAAEPLREGGASGFALTLERPDGSRRAVGAALGAGRGETFDLVLAVGEDRDAVIAAARRAAAGAF